MGFVLRNVLGAVRAGKIEFADGFDYVNLRGKRGWSAPLIYIL